MTIIRNVLYRTVAAVARRRLARVLVVVAVAAAGVLTVSGAASAERQHIQRNPKRGHQQVSRRQLPRTATTTSVPACSSITARGSQEQQWRAVQINSIDGYSPTWEIVSQRSGLCLGRKAVCR